MGVAKLSAACRYRIVHGSQVSAPRINGMRMSRRIFHIQSNHFYFKKSGWKSGMNKIQSMVMAFITCVALSAIGQEYEIEVLTAPRASRLVAETEEGATNLILPYVSSVDQETAHELAKATQSGLLLDGLLSVDKSTAKELATFSGFVLSLNGVTNLDLETANEISAFGGRALVLNGLEIIDEITLRNLVQFKGQALFLDGLKEMGPEVAESLIGFRGSYLGIYGLKKIDKEVMAVLMRWRGEKISLCEDTLTVKAKNFMASNKRSWEIIGDVWAAF